MASLRIASNFGQRELKRAVQIHASRETRMTREVRDVLRVLRVFHNSFISWLNG